MENQHHSDPTKDLLQVTKLAINHTSPSQKRKQI